MGGSTGGNLLKAVSIAFPVIGIGNALATSKFGGSSSTDLDTVHTVAPDASRSLALGNVTGSNAAKSASAALSQDLSQQNTQAAAAEQRLLAAPKNITPDNFLAMKNQQLTNLKLGLASTMVNPGGGPSPVLSRPSLAAGGPGKTKLGQ